MRLLDNVKMSDIDTKLLYPLRYGFMRTLIFACRTSSFAGAGDIGCA
jgi:hypothetical protein